MRLGLGLYRAGAGALGLRWAERAGAQRVGVCTVGRGCALDSACAIEQRVPSASEVATHLLLAEVKHERSNPQQLRLFLKNNEHFAIFVAALSFAEC